MDRLACISLPGLSLQVALRKFPPGFQAPLALVADDRPASPLLAVNRWARERGLQPGLRYSEALGIERSLRAVTVSDAELASAREEVLDIARRFSPVVDVCPFDGGSFWLEASGLQSLYGSEVDWGRALRNELARLRYRGVVVVGHTRGGTYVLARTRRRSTVVRSIDAERRALDEAPLGVFPVTARHRRQLALLGLTTLASVLAVPTEELTSRFGPELIRDLRSLEALNSVPLQGVAEKDTLIVRRKLEPGVTDRTALLALLEAPVLEGLASLGRRGRLLSELHLVFVLESGALETEVFRPAEPTLRSAVLLKLLGLRLDRCEWSEAVVELRLAFSEASLPPSSEELFSSDAPRDLRRGSEALALIRARWGNGAVVRARLIDSHVPDRSFLWEPVERLSPPRVHEPRGDLTAVRRVPRPGNTPAGNPSGERLGRSCRLHVLGPQPVDKEYWFLRNRRQEVAWVSWDRLAGRPCWEGMVD